MRGVIRSQHRLEDEDKPHDEKAEQHDYSQEAEREDDCDNVRDAGRCRVVALHRRFLALVVHVRPAHKQENAGAPVVQHSRKCCCRATDRGSMGSSGIATLVRLGHAEQGVQLTAA